MHHAPNIFDVLADPQVERVPLNRCRVIGRPDGSRMVAVNDNGVTVIGPLVVVNDPAQWPFEAGAGEMIVFMSGAPDLARDIREALNNPRLSVEGFGELMQDPVFKTVADLTNTRTIAVEGIKRLVDDLVAARGMAAEDSIADCIDLVDAVIENGRDLLEELQKPEPQ